MKEVQINRLMDALKVMRDLNSDMNINMVLTMLEVAKGRGVTGRDLEGALDLKHATAARMLRYFDRWQTAGKPGLDLVRVELDPMDYKSKLRLLNDNGEALVAKLDDKLNGR